jgi:small conductance mechanosensitive channel
MRNPAGWKRSKNCFKRGSKPPMRVLDRLKTRNPEGHPPMTTAVDPALNVDTITEYVATVGINVILNVAMAALILFVGLFIAGFVSRNVRRATEKHPRIDDTLAAFFASIIRYVIIAIVIIAVLTRFGVETTSMVAALGAAALAIGLALQGTLANVAAGVMIVFFRPYKIGDFVDLNGTMGTVKDINLFLTVMATPDNKQVIVPNGQAWSNVITNFSANPTRRVDFTFSTSYDDDIEHVRSVIRRVMEADERFHKDPPVFVEVSAHADSSINYAARGWCDTADYWPIFWDITRKMKIAFDEEGIEIPFPHRVHVLRQERGQKIRVAPLEPAGDEMPELGGTD